MNIKFKVSLVLVAVAGLAYFQNKTPGEIESHQVSLSKTARSRTSTAVDQGSLNSPKAIAPFQELQPRTLQHVALKRSTNPIAIRATQVSLTEIEEFKIDRDLDLQENIQNDLMFLFSIEQRERDFLFNEVRVTPEKYQRIMDQKKIVQWQLGRAREYAKTRGYKLQDVKKSILATHVFWMQSTIGVGYYNRLLELSE